MRLLNLWQKLGALSHTEAIFHTREDEITAQTASSNQTNPCKYCLRLKTQEPCGRGFKVSDLGFMVYGVRFGS